jgi:hypothetical protein
MAREIFRKTALNRLASPDQLDQLMQVTSLRGWIALAGLALVLFFALLWGWFGTISTTVESKGVLLRGSGMHPLTAPVDGVVKKILPKLGEVFKKGNPLVLLTVSEAGKNPLEVPVVSPFDGRLLNRVAKVGQPVKKGTALVMLESLEEHLFAFLYIPVSEGYQVQKDMQVHIWPASVKKEAFGYLKGEVVAASRGPTNREEVAERLQNADMAAELTEGGAKLQVIAKLVPDTNTISGYQWSTGDGPPETLYSGTPCQARIITGRRRPIQLVFPSLGK